MYVDIFFACGLIFLITLVNPSGHTITTNILKTDIKTLRITIRQHLGRYGQKNMHITQLHSDNNKGKTAMALDFSGSVQCFKSVQVCTYHESKERLGISKNSHVASDPDSHTYAPLKCKCSRSNRRKLRPKHCLGCI